jgi:chitin disaccharide deacetylase
VLIVNADDWGRSEAETDAALACFRHNRITSVTAMTFMADSERAARIALDHGIPAGLHLNLTEPLTAPGTDRVLLEEHGRLVKFLTRGRYSAVVLNPFLRRSLCTVFQRQLEEFLRLYRKPPTHFDGHRHFHLCLSMLFAAPIPRGQRVRRTFSFTVGEKGLVNWLYRRALDRWVVRRYRTTDYFFALSQSMTDSRLAAVAQLARKANVELMTHPIAPAERTFLLSAEFEQRTSGVDWRSYVDL